LAEEPLNPKVIQWFRRKSMGLENENRVVKAVA
jgi:hypothetical protein